MGDLSSDRKRLVENLFFLSFLQAINYLLPLITIPYLVRVLGPERFGLIAFAQSFVQYFIIFTDYGFNFSATRRISISRDDSERVSYIFSSVMLIKILFLVTAFLIFLGLVAAVPKFRDYRLIYMFTFGTVAGNVLFPLWLFQGIERMKYISFLNITMKALFTLGIFVFIKRQSDYLYVPAINSISLIAIGIVSLWLAWHNCGVRPKMPSISDITGELKEGWHVFVSTMAISLYTTSNTFMLGLFTNNTIVGYYSAGEKIINVVQGMLSPISQTVYPYISKLANDSRDQALYFLNRAGLILKGILLLISLTIFILARPIVTIVLGNQYKESVIVLRILAFVPFVVGNAAVYANFFLLGFGYLREWSRIIITCGLSGIILALIFIRLLSLAHIGASIAWLTTECLVLIFSYVSYKRLKYAYR